MKWLSGVTLIFSVAITGSLLLSCSSKHVDEEPNDRWMAATYGVVRLDCDQPDKGSRAEVFVRSNSIEVPLAKDATTPTSRLKIPRDVADSLANSRFSALDGRSVASTDGHTLKFKVDGKTYDGAERLGVQIEGNTKGSLSSCTVGY